MEVGAASSLSQLKDLRLDTSSRSPSWLVASKNSSVLVLALLLLKEGGSIRGIPASISSSPMGLRVGLEKDEEEEEEEDVLQHIPRLLQTNDSAAFMA